MDERMEAAEGKTDFLGLCDIADIVIRSRMLDKFLRTPEPALGIDREITAIVRHKYFRQAQCAPAGAVGYGALANMFGQHAQVFHDALGMREDVAVNPLQNDLAAGIGSDEKSIIDQSLPMRLDGADISTRNELAGNVLFNGHGGFDGQAGAALG